ncbi:MAG TPA: amidohydrolase family protein, partial [Plasticicumulans sp.]|nr:amidohydrolase family protein [Plasticicumulans sp.]
IAGLTRHAARALGLAATHGTLEPGKIADFSIWKVEHPAELAYWLGGQICTGRVLAGRPVAAEADRCLSIPSTT